MIRSRSLAFGAVAALLALTGSSPARVSAQSASVVVISEVHPAGSGNGTYNADWFEVTNTGTERRGHHRLEDGRQLERVRHVRSRSDGVTSIPAGKSAVFFESSTAASPIDHHRRFLDGLVRQRDAARRVPHRRLRRLRRRAEHQRRRGESLRRGRQPGHRRQLRRSHRRPPRSTTPPASAARRCRFRRSRR